VPLQIAVGGAARDENDITTAEAAQALKGRQPVTASRPAPEDFAEAYRAAADSGAPVRPGMLGVVVAPLR